MIDHRMRNQLKIRKSMLEKGSFVLQTKYLNLFKRLKKYCIFLYTKTKNDNNQKIINRYGF